MATLIETLRSAIVTSIYGRRVGLDNSGFLVGPADMRTQVEDISTTAATSMANYGITRILTSGSSQTGSYTLQAPIPGVRKVITLDTTSTGIMVVYPTGATVFQSSGSSGTSVGSSVFSLRGNGAVIDLIAVSTFLWRQVNNPSTAQALVLHSSST